MTQRGPGRKPRSNVEATKELLAIARTADEMLTREGHGYLYFDQLEETVKRAMRLAQQGN